MTSITQKNDQRSEELKELVNKSDFGLFLSQWKDGKWHWYYRCDSSENYADVKSGFRKPEEAMLDFAKRQCRVIDIEISDAADPEASTNETEDILKNENHIYFQIKEERINQLSKWGVQNHESYEPNVSHGEAMTKFFNIPSEAEAKKKVDQPTTPDDPTWTAIAIEELAEAVSADNESSLREELIQLAATIVAWIENIDRRKAKSLAKPSKG